MDLIYRTAIHTDQHALMELATLAYGQFKTVLTPENWEKMYASLQSPELYAGLLEKSEVFICEGPGGILVGMACLLPSGNPTPVYPADWSYIRMVGVHPRFEGRGIARTLTQQCIRSARARGEKIIGLHTSEMMDAARHIYEKCGFVKTRELGLRYGKMYWLYRMNLA